MGNASPVLISAERCYYDARVLAKLTQQVNRLEPLSVTDVATAMRALVDETVAVEAKADFLIGLNEKGETSEEIAAFVRELRQMSIQPPLDEATRALEILDVVGTGGDHLNTINISTTAALISAAAGVTVAKHGNRAITSKCGSADVLEALGIQTDLSPEQAAKSLRDRQFAFLFAPRYHPAFKHIGPARKLCAERGRRTLFNYLGPLLNPVRPTAMLIGTARPELCAPMARVLQSIGVRRAMVVSGSVPAPDGTTRYLDEISTLGETSVAEFVQEHAISVSTLNPGHFPVRPARLIDLVGGTPEENAAIVRDILNGAEQGPRRDAVLLNAAAALYVAGKTRTMSEGWELAAELLANGAALRKLAQLATPL
jgi:anthranilate phosphoribosyltransferase